MSYKNTLQDKWVTLLKDFPEKLFEKMKTKFQI